MIPQVKSNNLISSGTTTSTHFEISSKNTAHIMQILRDTLYSDKITSIIREYSSNAWDANRQAGHNGPIIVTLPTISDMTFKVRDNGIGLSEDDIINIYTKYGESTKRDDNVAVGMLGIGSKSGFAYSDSFTVTSWHNGTKRVYVAVIDESNKGKMDLIDSSPCGVYETGIEIAIPVKQNDINDFVYKATNFYKYFNPKPKTNIEISYKKYEYHKCGKHLVAICGGGYDYCYYGASSETIAVMGCVPYKINLNEIREFNGIKLNENVRKLNIILNCDIGSLEFTASREDLKYTDVVKSFLISEINTVIQSYIDHLLSDIDKLTDFEKWNRVLKIRNMGFSAQQKYSHFSSTRCSSSGNKLQGISFKSYANYNKSKFRKTDYFYISDKLFFVIKDVRKGLKLYESNADLRDAIIVCGEGNDSYNDILNKLNKFISASFLNGIRIDKLSNYKFDETQVKARSVDAKKAKASVFALKQDADFNYTTPSKNWDIKEITPSDDDIYVILNSYRADGFDSFADSTDFYSVYSSIRTCMKNLGVKHPEVIGYKNTEKNPVDKSKIKGIEYKNWLSTKMLDCFSDDIKEAVYSVVWMRKTNTGAGINIIDHAYSLAQKILNYDNVVLDFLGKVNKYTNIYSKEKYSKNSQYVIALANYVDFNKISCDIINKISLKYPMLSIPQISIEKMWNDTKFCEILKYIADIDSKENKNE